jgi:hypothetical protein
MGSMLTVQLYNSIQHFHTKLGYARSLYVNINVTKGF